MCSCHQQRLEVVLMIENYLTAIIYILLIALVITAIIAFALIVVLTIVLSKQQKKHISALARVKCAFFINGNHIFVDPYFPIL